MTRKTTAQITTRFSIGALASVIRKTAAQTTAVLSIVGALASVAALLAILAKTLNLSEFSLSILSTLLGVSAGIYSIHLARFAKKFRISRRVFISSSYADQSVAQEIADALRANGARVWLDLERLEPGESIREVVQEGIQDADSFVALLSQEPRPNVLLELGMARARGLRIIPVLLADGELPPDLLELRYIDFRHERAQGLEELVKATT